MNSKTRTKLKTAPALIIGCMIVVSACLKLAGAAPIVDQFKKAGIAEYIQLFGGMEIIFVALFLYPLTMRIGLLLLSAYFGGAMAIELTRGGIIVPMVILSVIWVAAFLRNPYLFRQTEKQIQPIQLSINKF